ncbi:MAG TPA: anaerobic ribonucleoside-triphosphate reductase activating protein [Treponema sp.]|nr:anaerobic ribonucleoside-triphosphate reductase activating protein [Treponema sp.]
MQVGLQKTSLVNFPGKVCAVVFLPGCNLRCPYCHNGELATASVASGPQGEKENEYVPLEKVFAHLEKRKNVLGGLAISGGEPLLSPALSECIKKARSLGLGVKIDTNGTLSERLNTVLSDPELKPDIIAIDIKTSPNRYGELTIEAEAGERAATELEKSLKILKNEVLLGTLAVEYRTVLVPGLVGESDIREIASRLPHTANWQLTAFVPGTCLDPEWNSHEAYGPAERDRLITLAKSLIPTAEYR